MPKVPEMVFSRPPLERMHRIFHLIQQEDYPNCTGIAREFEVSTRTIKRDVDFLKCRYNLPIEFDAQGNVATGFSGSVTVAIDANPGGGTLSGTTNVSAANGVATFSNLSIDRAGNGYTLSATAGGVAGATSNSFNIM